MPSTELLPSGRYRAIYRTAAGKRYVKGTFPHKKAAQNAAAAEEAKAMSLGWRDPKAASRTWGEWCANWWPTRGVEPGVLNRDRYSRDACLMPKWGDVPLIDITRHDVKAWAAALAKGGMAWGTVQKRIYLLSASLTAAIDAEILTVNPAAKIKLPSGETDVRRYLTVEESEALLLQFQPPVDHPINEALVRAALGTGMRWGELVGLQIKRVALSRRTIRVAEVWDAQMRRLKPYPKGRKIRDVPIPEWLVLWLTFAIGDRKTGFVFLHEAKSVLEYSNWRQRFWLPAVECSELGAVRFHDLRHTYASRLLQNGVTLAEVGKLLGHVSPITTQRYAHLAEVPRTNVLAALPDPSRGTRVGLHGILRDGNRPQSTEA